MGRSFIGIGLALLALWVILSVTRVAVGGLMWLILVAAAVVLAIGAFNYVSGRGSRSTL
jgi:hypothetical protein